jgi:hypothetical protein
MTIGTRSLLFGVHQFLLHPLFVAWAWWRLYGFPWQPALWFCILVHDWGYWGKPNMDGPEGERHPELGARLASYILDGWPWQVPCEILLKTPENQNAGYPIGRWGQFCLFHSRHYAKRQGRAFSRLAVADKYAICLYPDWLYIELAWLTGELREYIAVSNAYASNNPSLTEEERRGLTSIDLWEWRAGINAYMARWVENNKGAD